ncbi:hypothetical protein K8I61_02350, partial [bacterium]|nr:hypothetical protein [bacterium]
MIHAAVALSVAGFAYLLFDFLRATRAGAPIHDLPKRGAAFALLLAIAASCASIAAFNDATRASINVPIPGAETDETLTYFGPGTDWAIFPFDDSYITLGAARKRIEPFADGSASYAGVTSPGHIELLNDFVNGTRSPALFRNRVNGPIPEFLRGSSGDSLVFQMLSAMAAHAFGDSVRVLLVPLVYLVLAVMGCPRAGAFSAVAVGASGAFTFHALSGMETAAFVCVVAVTWAFAATALVRPYHSNVRLFLAVQVFVYLLFVDWNFYSLVRRPNPLHATLCLLLAIGGTIVAACRLTGPRGRVGRWKRVFIAFTFFLAAATVMNFRLLLGSEFDLPFDSIWIGEIVEFLISGGLIAIGWAIAPKLPSARPFLGRILTLAAAAVLAKWAFEFRPDALFLLAAIGVAGVWAWRVNGDRQPLGIAVAILVVTAVFALPGINYRWGVFEGILPPTGEAKSAFFNLGERGPGPAVAATLIGFGKLLARHIAFVPLMILGVRSAIGRKRGDLSERQMQSGVTAVIGLAFVVIFYAAYGAKFAAGLNMYWLRYHMPVQFVLLVFAGAGFAALAARAPAASDGTKA